MPWVTSSGARVLQQTEMQSCGYCCVAMVNQLLTGDELSEKSVRFAGRRVDPTGAYMKYAGDIVGGQRLFLADVAESRGDYYWGEGTFGSHLADVLRQEYSINATYHAGQSPGQIKAAMKAVRADKPMIVLVHWNGGGGHWVVVAERHKKTFGTDKLTILDPDGNKRKNTGYVQYLGGIGSFGGYFITVDGMVPRRGIKVL